MKRSAAALRDHLRHSLRYDLASTLVRHEPPPRQQVATPVRELDQLVGGFPRGAITELIGPASSGRTSFVQSSLARLTQAGECCAYLDATDAFDPATAAQAGADLSHILWARCANNLEKLWKCADLLLQSGGFGMVVLDLADVPVRELQRIPLSTWYRFRQAIEKSPTILLILAENSQAKSCTSLLLSFTPERAAWAGAHPAHRLLERLRFEISARKPMTPQPVLAWASGWEG